MSALNDPRVLFAAERTLLAWSRTSLALIGFGFLLERTGLMFSAMYPEKVNAHSMLLTFCIGAFFIVTGAGAAAYSTRQYGNILKTLNDAEFPPGYDKRWAMYVNMVIAVLGAGLLLVLIVGQL